MITVRSAMSSEKEKRAGMVEANRSKIEEEDRGGITALLAKFTRNGGGKTFVCFNCAKVAGHSAKDCPLAKKHGPAKCKYCHGPHNSKVHNSHFPDAKKPAAEGDDDEDDVVAKLKSLTKKQLKTVKAHLTGLGPEVKAAGTGAGDHRTGQGRSCSNGRGGKGEKAAGPG